MAISRRPSYPDTNHKDEVRRMKCEVTYFELLTSSFELYKSFCKHLPYNETMAQGGSTQLTAADWSALPPEYAIPEMAPSLAEACAYCRKLATSHYENFSVATWFLP